MAPSRPLIGRDPAWLDVMRDVDLIAPYDEPVLLTGQTGTGKSFLAREIHARSPRAAQPFLTLDCNSLTRDLVETQLLGIERNVASNVGARAGFFELADGGTLFIDELGDLPIEMQPKLLHALQTGEVLRIGAAKPVVVNVRVIAATNADLTKMVQEKRFREDLYWRLARLRLDLPALSERPLDVAEFARAELARANEQRKRAGRPAAQFSPAALLALQEHDWSTDVDGLGGDGGGLRELFALVWRALVAADRSARPGARVTIEVAHLSLPRAPSPVMRAPPSLRLSSSRLVWMPRGWPRPLASRAGLSCDGCAIESSSRANTSSVTAKDVRCSSSTPITRAVDATPPRALPDASLPRRSPCASSLSPCSSLP